MQSMMIIPAHAGYSVKTREGKVFPVLGWAVFTFNDGSGVESVQPITVRGPAYEPYVVSFEGQKL